MIHEYLVFHFIFLSNIFTSFIYDLAKYCSKLFIHMHSVLVNALFPFIAIETSAFD